MKFVLLNSFDRSGSTLISKALSHHRRVETFFNPFNGSIFRREFMREWSDSTANEILIEGKQLVDRVLNGDFDRSHIQSRVFFQNSSAFRTIQGSLHIIKTTNFHLKFAWFNQNFSTIPVFALIRNPLGILASLVRNNFHIDWYGGWGFSDLRKFIVESKAYDEQVTKFLLSFDDEVRRMAVIIGVLNAEMLRNIDKNNTLRYEKILEDPNYELNSFTSRFGLESFDFAPYFRDTVNSSGLGFSGEDVFRKVFSRREVSELSRIFEACGSLGYKY